MTDIERQLSIPAKNVFVKVQREVVTLDHLCVQPEHLLIGLMNEMESNAFALLTTLNVDFAALRGELLENLTPIPCETAPEESMTEATKRLLEYGLQSRSVLGRPYLGTEHLLIAMLRDMSSRVYSVLHRHGVTYNKVFDLLTTLPKEPCPGEQPGKITAPPISVVPPEKLTIGFILRNISPVFLLLVMLTVVSGMSAFWRWFRPDIAVFLFVTLGWITSVSMHEFGHALVAYLGGDKQVLARGYLTLNPLKYTHGFLSIVLPVIFLALGGIGLPGGVVYVNLSAIKKRSTQSLLSAAGPMMTGLVAVLLSLPFASNEYLYRISQHPEFWGGLTFLVFIQVWAFLFNLLPVPGFDGFGIIQPFLPRALVYRLNRFGSMILFLFLGFYMWNDSFQRFFWGIVGWVMNLLGGNIDLLLYAMDLYRFW